MSSNPRHFPPRIMQADSKTASIDSIANPRIVCFATRSHPRLVRPNLGSLVAVRVAGDSICPCRGRTSTVDRHGSSGFACCPFVGHRARYATRFDSRYPCTRGVDRPVCIPQGLQGWTGRVEPRLPPPQESDRQAEDDVRECTDVPDRVVQGLRRKIVRFGPQFSLTRRAMADLGFHRAATSPLLPTPSSNPEYLSPAPCAKMCASVPAASGNGEGRTARVERRTSRAAS